MASFGSNAIPRIRQMSHPSSPAAARRASRYAPTSMADRASSWDIISNPHGYFLARRTYCPCTSPPRRARQKPCIRHPVNGVNVPLNPFPPSPYYVDAGRDTVRDPSLRVYFFLLAIVVWIIYTLIVCYHWLRYGHRSWFAIPAIVLHIFMSGFFIIFALSGLRIVWKNSNSNLEKRSSARCGSIFLYCSRSSCPSLSWRWCRSCMFGVHQYLRKLQPNARPAGRFTSFSTSEWHGAFPGRYMVAPALDVDLFTTLTKVFPYAVGHYDHTNRRHPPVRILQPQRLEFSPHTRAGRHDRGLWVSSARSSASDRLMWKPPDGKRNSSCTASAILRAFAT